jgi:hypothetical protein
MKNDFKPVKRRTVKWHLLLVLSVLVSRDCTRI